MTTPRARADRPVTLAEIAAVAGVAISTASRALANPERVNAATRERIARIAEEMQYVPANAGRPAGRTRAIAVFVSDVTNPFYFGIIRGTQQQLKAAGYTQLLIDTEESDELEDTMIAHTRGSFEGAIIAASRLSDRRLIQLASQVPLVAINRQTAGIPTVFIDTPHGMEQALEHLVSLGHRKIAYAAGPETSWPNEGRWRALLRVGRRHGIQPIRIGPFSPTKNSGAAAADAALNTGVTACIAFNDLLAIGMQMRLHERGIDVPGDMSIVGCDDIFGADFCSPPLTTLTAPIEQAGRVAVSILLGRLEARTDAYVADASTPPPRRTATLPTHLTIRSSTGPAPRGDES